MQQHFIIQETQANGTLRSFAVEHLSPIKALPHAHYALIDTSTGKTPEGLKLHREGNSLKVLLGDVNVLQINDFYNADVLAQFSTDGNFAINDNVLISASSDDSNTLAGASSGDPFARLDTS